MSSAWRPVVGEDIDKGSDHLMGLHESEPLFRLFVPLLGGGTVLRVYTTPSRSAPSSSLSSSIAK
jgi:hypothetical protein